MPVVNLQRDTRFGDLGAGLGAIGAQLYQQQQQQEAAKGTADIWNDPNAGDANVKLSKITKQYGWLGVAYAHQLQLGQIKQQQLAESKAREQEILAGVGLNTIREKILAAQYPTAGAKAEAEVEQMRTGTAHTAAETNALNTLLPGKVTAQGQENELNAGLMAPKIEAAGSEAATKTAESQLITTQVGNVLNRLNKGANLADATGAGSLDDMMSKMNLPEDVKARARAEAQANSLNFKDPNAGAKAALKVINEYGNARTRADITANAPKQTPQPQIQAASNASSAAFSAKQFMDAFDKGGYKEVGIFTGGPFKAFLEKYGVATGDTNVIRMHNAQEQAVADFAKNHGGFGGSWLVKLGKDVTPGINESPMRSIVAMGEEVGKLKQSLETQRSGLAPNQSTKPLDTAIKQLDEVYQWTHSLQSYVTKDTNGQDHTVAFFNNKQVNPRTFEPLVDGAKTYKGPNGATVSGSDAMAAGRKAGVDPYFWLRSRGFNVGAQ